MKSRKSIFYRLFLIVYIIAMWTFKNPFSFMSLNVFLAWVPIEFGILFGRLRTKWQYLFGGLWLLFFPNVPYLLTDFFHLQALDIYQKQGLFRSDSYYWFLYLLLILPIFIMVLVGMKQALELTKRIPYLRNYPRLSLLALAFLSGIAIYIGRFERIHSIELVLHPLSTFVLLVGSWSVEKLQFVLIFMIIQCTIWFLLNELQIFKIED